VVGGKTETGTTVVVGASVGATVSVVATSTVVGGAVVVLSSAATTANLPSSGDEFDNAASQPPAMSTNPATGADTFAHNGHDRKPRLGGSEDGPTFMTGGGKLICRMVTDSETRTGCRAPMCLRHASRSRCRPRRDNHP
jgi:hypothetical protein